MFLKTTYERNKKLIDESIKLHQQGLILPNSYIVDMDTLEENAKIILENAKQKEVRLYFMLKQLGRNPYIAKKLIDIGFEGAVVVDYSEAIIMMENNIPIGNIGNLVQIPNALIEKVLRYGVDYITIFSLDKLKLINKIAEKLQIVQKVILRVWDENDKMYPSQEAGINIFDLEQFIENSKELKNVAISGATSFPAYLYNLKAKKIEKLENCNTIYKAIEIMQNKGLVIDHINTPSLTCSKVINEFFDRKNLVGEPGHGLTGSTPIHVNEKLEEKPCVIYLTEVSHNFKNHSYLYGGGYYRRSHVSNVLISSKNDYEFDEILPMNCDNIDYYFETKKSYDIGSTAIMAFRFQIFVTRSNVVILENIKNNPRIAGVYDSQGRKLDE